MRKPIAWGSQIALWMVAAGAPGGCAMLPAAGRPATEPTAPKQPSSHCTVPPPAVAAVAFEARRDCVGRVVANCYGKPGRSPGGDAPLGCVRSGVDDCERSYRFAREAIAIACL